MADKEEKVTNKQKAAPISYQKQLDDVDRLISDLQVKKKELAVLALKEISETVEIPLHQLNAIAKLGHKKAKESFGNKWVD